MIDLARFALMVFIGGLIGYSTNKIAVKMLFRPLNPKKILFFRFQGLLPKRKAIIALSMGETIESAFLNKEDIFDTFMNEETMATFKTVLKERLTEKIIEIVPKLLQNMLGDNLKHKIEQFIDKEGDSFIAEMFENIKNEGLERLNIPLLVREKVESLDMLAFEKLVYDMVKKELKHIEYIGLYLGMLIGAFQFLVMMIVS